MKISIDVDITPRELRSFFGLPDIKPLQDEMLDRIQEKMSTSVEGFDAINLMKPLLPAHMQSLDVVQKAFWQIFSKDKTSIVSTEAEKGSLKDDDKDMSNSEIEPSK
uniref:Uncharacterized protein n=1 Tax=Candidatus Kentrum sp. TUN TaxID=2126343 RepID=A0A450ZZZ6_9GAMM|nr:MAG: hypothetical protein BECKTUN1418E_GA0071001_100510 [Candidatus Kentron sp. TUN]VFK51327.1 MAG: hypothetical protein BECKTUN1418D_GA0071000_10079 [Candidatus Kentron sp. TUN]VFK59354.1 MAG: hypothetical protein BECKTUN1418F_GA0071002_11724 [Candidatus Kentron sp. TUN]